LFDFILPGTGGIASFGGICPERHIIFYRKPKNIFFGGEGFA
jgi:hypothetical protein